MTIPVIDVFAGPGGLGEGFAAFVDEYGNKPFQIILSAESNTDAHATLRLRAFYRKLVQHGKDTSVLLEYCLGKKDSPYSHETEFLWQQACSEVLCLELGTSSGDKILYRNLRKRLKSSNDWVLIGGPPCQAYSVAGRVRNKANGKYDPLKDRRHFLYREYLKLLNTYRPAVFVMENVRGMLSCKLNGDLIAHKIFQDLSTAGCTNEKNKKTNGYRVYSLTDEIYFESGMDVKSLDMDRFVIRAEQYGIPQTRHRVILLGVRKDINVEPGMLVKQTGPNVEQMIMDLPKLRSGISREKDSSEKWHDTVARELWTLADHARVSGHSEFANDLEKYGILVNNQRLNRKVKVVKSTKRAKHSCCMPEVIRTWISGIWDDCCFNHESRMHMVADLRRYAYATVFSRKYKRYPKGSGDFFLPGLSPNHKNWKKGVFEDRFRVQIEGHPATTITSHISKDGHYYIHPDPVQCRSFTVREAARIQTFPDDYFFCGSRTAQYTQVGNAVPPYLAFQIADIVFKVLNKR
jgi:DNA (cytosine-5)-methyltransferase 1